jgi:hypothetical protein
VQVSTSFSDLQEFGSKIIGPHIATERPSAPVRPYAPGMRKNRIGRHFCWIDFGPSAFSVQMVAPALTGVRRPHDGY